jgi:hypothetical protein
MLTTSILIGLIAFLVTLTAYLLIAPLRAPRHARSADKDTATNTTVPRARTR